MRSLTLLLVGRQVKQVSPLFFFLLNFVPSLSNLKLKVCNIHKESNMKFSIKDLRMRCETWRRDERFEAWGRDDTFEEGREIIVALNAARLVAMRLRLEREGDWQDLHLRLEMEEEGRWRVVVHNLLLDLDVGGAMWLSLDGYRYRVGRQVHGLYVVAVSIWCPVWSSLSWLLCCVTASVWQCGLWLLGLKVSKDF